MKIKRIAGLAAAVMALSLVSSSVAEAAAGYEFFELVEGDASGTGYIPAYDPAEELDGNGGEGYGELVKPGSSETSETSVSLPEETGEDPDPADAFSDGGSDWEDGTELSQDFAETDDGEAVEDGEDEAPLDPEAENEDGTAAQEDFQGSEIRFTDGGEDTEVWEQEDADAQALYSTPELPVRYSLVQNGYGSPVENQGNLGICWAFSTLESVETGLMLRGLASPGLNLSETHLSYTAYHGTNQDPADGTSGETFLPYGARWTRLGGNKYYSTATLARGYGAAYESDYPLSMTYEADGADRSASTVSILDSIITSQAKKTSVSRLKNAYWLLDVNSASTAKDRISRINAIKTFIYTYGAVETGMLVNGYNAPYDRETNSFYTPSDAANKTPNHSVALVGWDDEKETAAAVPGAFLVQNSWGDSAGENGLFWLSYEDCSMKSPAFYEMRNEPVGSVKEQIIHQYDGTGYNSVIRPAEPRDDLRISGANVFTAREAQYLTQVGFYAGASSLPYTISIYRYVSSSPGTGYLVATQSGKNQYSGYYTVDLKNPVPIAAGEKFAVQLTFDHKNGYVPHEKGTAAYRQYTAERGQSYLFDGSQWVDMMDLKDENGSSYACNICIKAFGERTSDPISLKPSAPAVTASLASENKLNVSLKGTGDIVTAYNYVVGTSPDFLSTRKFTAKKTGTTSTSVNFYSLTKGTYYVAARAYRKEKNGDVVYGEWSKLSAVTVTADTPELPVISAASVVNGNRVSVTVKAPSAAAQTYIFALGTSSDFAQNANYYKKMTVSGRRTAVFDYIPKGTYYAAVRAYNVSPSGKKLYSAWSAVKKVKVTATTPGTPSFQSVTPGSGTLKAVYTRASGATKYEYVLTTKKFYSGTYDPASRYATYTGRKYGSASIKKNLKKGTYYFGVRGYRFSGGVKVYGKWTVKKVTIR